MKIALAIARRLKRPVRARRMLVIQNIGLPDFRWSDVQVDSDRIDCIKRSKIVKICCVSSVLSKDRERFSEAVFET